MIAYITRFIRVIDYYSGICKHNIKT